MKKITLLGLGLFLSFASYAQVSVEILAHPNSFTSNGLAAGNFRSAVGENPLIVKFYNIPDATSNTSAAPAPIRTAASVQTSLGSVTIPSTGDFTGLLGTVFNPGSPNFGYTNLHQVKVNDPCRISS